MAVRKIRSQLADKERILKDEKEAERRREQAATEIEELREKQKKAKEELHALSNEKEELEGNLAELREKTEKLLRPINEEIEKIEMRLESVNQVSEKLMVELISFRDELEKNQRQLRITNGTGYVYPKRRIRSIQQDSEEEEIHLMLPNALLSKAKVGDYVKYVGDRAPNTTIWRVCKVTEKEVMITPVLNNNGEAVLLRLKGLNGYLNVAMNAESQTDKINKECKKHYKNASLGITSESIRSLTLEDIFEIFDPDFDDFEKVDVKTTRIAYYPKGTNLSKNPIMYGENMYIRTAHCLKKARFYTSDGGGVEKRDIHGNIYRQPELNNPVYVTSKDYNFDKLLYKKNRNITTATFLGHLQGWLASTSIKNISKSLHYDESWQDYSWADFCVAIIEDGELYDAFLIGSDNYVKCHKCALRPLVSLGYAIKVTGGNGTEVAPYEIARY